MKLININDDFFVLLACGQPINFCPFSYFSFESLLSLKLTKTEMSLKYSL